MAPPIHQDDDEVRRERSNTSLLRDVNETFCLELIPGQPDDHCTDVLVCAIDADMKEETLQIWTDWANKSGDEPDASWSLPVMSAISKHEGLVLGTMGLEHIRGAALSCSMTVGVFSPSDLGSAVALVAAYNILYKGQTYEEALKRLYDNTLSKFQGEKGTSPLNDMELYLNRVMTVELRSSLAAFELKAERIRSILSPLAVKSFYAFQRLVAERKTRDRQRADKPRPGTMDEAIDVQTETKHFRGGFPVDADFKNLEDHMPPQNQPSYHQSNTSRSRVNSDSIETLLSEDFTSIMRRPSAVGGPSSSVSHTSHMNSKNTSGRPSLSSMSSATGKGGKLTMNRNSLASNSTTFRSYQQQQQQQHKPQSNVVNQLHHPLAPVAAKASIVSQQSASDPKQQKSSQRKRSTAVVEKAGRRSVSPGSSSTINTTSKYRVTPTNKTGPASEIINSSLPAPTQHIAMSSGNNVVGVRSLKPSTVNVNSSKLKHNQVGTQQGPANRPVLVRPEKAVTTVLNDGRRSSLVSIESYGRVRRSSDRRSPERDNFGRHSPRLSQPRVTDRNISSSVSSVSSCSRTSLNPSPFTPRSPQMSPQSNQPSYFSQPKDPFNTSLLRMSQGSNNRGPAASGLNSFPHQHFHGNYTHRSSPLGQHHGHGGLQPLINGDKKFPIVPALDLARSRDAGSTSQTSYRDQPFRGPDVNHLDEPRANGHLVMSQNESGGSFFKKRDRWGCQFG